MPDRSPYSIQIGVDAHYVADQSVPVLRRYVFAYTVTIKNEGTVGARLLSRRWVITDAADRVKEVRGEGVVGEQPFLKPGESFRYTSGTLIETPYGSMQGEYRMVADDGVEFTADIPIFVLATPNALH